MHTKIETALKHHVQKVRILNSVITFSSFVLLIIILIIREITKTETDLGFDIKITHYNTAITLTAVALFICFALSLTILIYNLLLSKIDTVEVKGNVITLYRGIGSTKLYINGKEVEYCGGARKGKLDDGSYVIITMSRNHIFAQMEFTNGHSDIYL